MTPCLLKSYLCVKSGKTTFEHTVEHSRASRAHSRAHSRAQSSKSSTQSSTVEHTVEQVEHIVPLGSFRVDSAKLYKTVSVMGRTNTSSHFGCDVSQTGVHFSESGRKGSRCNTNSTPTTKKNKIASKNYAFLE
jgi:hypothetical protein